MTLTTEQTNTLNEYQNNLLNFDNLKDTYNYYKTDNVTLSKNAKMSNSNITTNYRKTYYEDQNITSLNSIYYYILLIIYIIVVICFIIFSLIYPSQISLKIRLLLLIVFISLPFVSTFILGKIIELIYWIFSLLPKNVYL